MYIKEVFVKDVRLSAFRRFFTHYTQHPLSDTSINRLDKNNSA